MAVLARTRTPEQTREFLDKRLEGTDAIMQKRIDARKKQRGTFGEQEEKAKQVATKAATKAVEVAKQPVIKVTDKFVGRSVNPVTTVLEGASNVAKSLRKRLADARTDRKKTGAPKRRKKSKPAAQPTREPPAGKTVVPLRVKGKLRPRVVPQKGFERLAKQEGVRPRTLKEFQTNARAGGNAARTPVQIAGDRLRARQARKRNLGGTRSIRSRTADRSRAR